MKTVILILAAGLATATAWGGESPVPTPPPAERYARMSQHSPFALATVVAPVAPPQASFAANWFVTGIARLNDTDFVSIQARDLSTQFSLIGHEPNRENDVALVEVQWSEKIGKSTVTLRKGTEVARLEFNEATVRGSAPAATPGGSARNPVGSAAGTPPNTVSPTTFPGATPSAGANAVTNIRRRILPITAPH